MRLLWVVLLLVACNDTSDRDKDAHLPVHPLPVEPGAGLDAYRDSGVRGKRARSPLPEAGPHPDYPTPVASGTDKIFTLEDPDRGARVPTTYKMPPRGTLSWSTHAYCDVGTLDVACGSGSGFARWHVGRRGNELIVAESMIGTRIVATYVFVAKPDGTPIRRVELDSFGRVAEMRTFTTSDRYSARRPSGGNGLPGCGSMAIKIDKSGRVTQESCLQWTGQPMRDTTGVATRRLVRDARGIVIAQHFLGLDGKPIADTDGVTTLRFDLDKAGRDAVRRYRDADDKPSIARNGCYGRRYEYDARGLEVRRTCLDFADRPQRAANGIAIESYRYDTRGCMVAVRYAAADGTAVTDRDNVHGIDIKPDERCLDLSRTCVNLAGRPIACEVAAPSRYVTAYDERGQLVSSKHYNADHSPGRDAAYEVFEVRWQYDEVGNPVGTSCYDSEGEPVECASAGYHALRRTYDDAGRNTQLRFFDTRGAPTTGLEAAAVHSTYDSYDHLFESTVVDADGELVETNGMTTRRDLYDTAHRRFAIVLLDRAGKPAQYTACYVGVTCPEKAWHAVRLVRGIDGRVMSNQFFDSTGQLVATQDCSTATCFD
jgi:hypothetical protein